jgi:hypothetical protein
VSTAHVRLVDEPDRSGRTTATLIASLGARLAVLHAVTGADAVGALVAGLAALGRETAKTAEGARLRDALAAGRAGANAEQIWSALLMDRWTSVMPPSPVLDHLRNDLALLLADDVGEILDLPPVPPEPVGVEGAHEPQPTTALDLILGLWTLAHEIIDGVEVLAEPTMPPAERVLVTATPPPTNGLLLR